MDNEDTNCPKGNGHWDQPYEEDDRKGFKCKWCKRIEWWDEEEK